MRGLAAALFVFAFLYRFNALGDTLGGFDGDHFHYYVRSVLVAHGERPMRDFADHGIQGAWPALTYELPALAMKLGGESLLSEALLAVLLIALSVTLLFVVAARVAGVLPALTVSLLTLFVGAKLYAYPKLIVFAVATWLLVRYATRPTRANAAFIAVWAAVAFLFRHDYVVYLVPAVAALMTVLHWRDRRALGARLLTCGALATLLLLAPLASIARHAGLTTYVRSGLAVSQREAQRTDLPWPRFERAAAGEGGVFGGERNAATWLYYVCLLVPVVALLRLWGAAPPAGLDSVQARALLVSLAILALALDWFFLRGNLAGRFGDLGVPVAVLAAWLLAAPVRAPGWIRGLARAGTAAILVLTVLAVETVGSVVHVLDTTGLSDGPRKIGRRLVTVARELRAFPDAVPGQTRPRIPLVAAYLRACTHPDDRILVMATAPEVFALAARGFAAGHPTFRAGYFTSTEEQRLMLDRLRSQSVPVVVTEPEQSYAADLATDFPLVDAYITSFYEPVGELMGPGDVSMRILARRHLTSSGTFGTTGLPCFGDPPADVGHGAAPR